MNRVIVLLLTITILSSCKKEEEKLPGRYLSDSIGYSDMVSEGGIDYRKQVYFDLSTNQNKASHDRDAWDFGFGCDPNHPNIFVNPSMLMRVAPTGSFDFNEALKPLNFIDSLEYERSTKFYRKGRLNKDFDNSFQPNGQVYLIDLGLDLNNQARGYKKLMIVAFDQITYTIRISNPDHSNVEEFIVAIDTSYNNKYISLKDIGNQLELEPPKREWDLLFTKYMERLFDGVDSIDYSVTGCLLNPHNTQAYRHELSEKDTTIGFYSLNSSDINKSECSNQLNIIGHNWKYFDLNSSGRFLIVPNRNYFILDSRGSNYRFRFTGFYGSTGNKGAISFEYLEL